MTRRPDVAFLVTFFGAMTATRVNDTNLGRYIHRRRTTPYRKDRMDCAGYATIRRELVDLKAIFSFAARRRPPLIALNPVRDFRLPREKLEINKHAMELALRRGWCQAGWNRRWGECRALDARLAAPV
jgi:hypothetical protein